MYDHNTDDAYYGDIYGGNDDDDYGDVVDDNGEVGEYNTSDINDGCIWHWL